MTKCAKNKLSDKIKKIIKIKYAIKPLRMCLVNLQCPSEKKKSEYPMSWASFA